MGSPLFSYGGTFLRFLFKAKKAAFTPAPVVPSMPRLMEDVVPDDRDDVDIILNTTTVRPSQLTHHYSDLGTGSHSVGEHYGFKLFFFKQGGRFVFKWG